MTAAGWISGREPAPPPRLAARLQHIAGADSVEEALLPRFLIERSAHVLRELLLAGETARDGALELLAADALVTYALEAQAGDPDGLDACCEWAMAHLSRAAGEV